MVSMDRPIRTARLVGMIVAALAMLSAPRAEAACADWSPLDNRGAAVGRAVTAADLIGLVNFGRPDAEPVGGPSPLALSPDGRWVATILQRADLATNGYCQALVVIDLRGRTMPRVLDRGGDYLMTTVAMRAMSIPNGFPRLNAPRWSPDGQAIAYLRRDNGRTQLWRVRLAGGPAQPVTHAPVDVDAWAWAGDGHSLVYASAPDRIAAEASIDREGVAGWHYDARTAPAYGIRPQVHAPLPQVTVLVDPETGATSPASVADQRPVAHDGDEPLDLRRTNARGDMVWAEREGASPLAPWRLHARRAGGASAPCGADACVGRILGLWWDGDGRHMTFLKREGWNERFAALYRWSPGRDTPRRLLRTDDELGGCRLAQRALLCVREGATRPPRLVSIDLGNGRDHLVFDPNPSFARLSLGSVRRLVWRTDAGREVYGDLVLPPDYHGRARLPTLIVQYSSRGFLRGGTGNEYPIYLLAARGFAVLSIQKPAMVAASFPMLTSFDEISVVNTRDWAERRNIASAIERGVELLVARGIADPARLGITGLSDGASAVRFALSRSRLFAAAAISSCCVEESSDTLMGPAWEAYSRTIGYPPAYPVDRAFWRPYSLALNADHIDTPLLMQLADSELLTGLPAYTALHAYRQPVDLYVFPGEFHIKWQPQHRRAVFERVLDWFSFWLQGREDPAPAKAAQFAHWRALRAAGDRAGRPDHPSLTAASRP